MIVMTSKRARVLGVVEEELHMDDVCQLFDPQSISKMVSRTLYDKESIGRRTILLAGRFSATKSPAMLQLPKLLD